MDEVTGLHPQAADLYRQPEVHHVHVGVRDGHVGGGELEAERLDLVEVAHRAVGDHPGTAERLVDVGLHLAHWRPLAARVVQVVDDDDPRGRNRQDIVPPAVGAGAVALQWLGSARMTQGTA